MQRSLRINGIDIPAGRRQTVHVPVGRSYTQLDMAMPVHVVHGRGEGPVLLITAAIHGDELNGVEIVRRLMRHPTLEELRGALLAVPVANVHGFLARSRYLPDRRDLNRSFPGARRGSLASRLADVIVTHLLTLCTHAVDLHTGAAHRENFPQILADLSHAETRRLAEAFGVPVIISADVPEGSFRQAAVARGVPLLLYEAGEALRLDETAIRAGMDGILRVMVNLGMLPVSSGVPSEAPPPIRVRKHAWVRAIESGLLLTQVQPGDMVSKGEVLGTLADPVGERETEVRAPFGGVVTGLLRMPLVHEGEALFNLARCPEVAIAAQRVDCFRRAFRVQPVYP